LYEVELSQLLLISEVPQEKHYGVWGGWGS